MFGYRSVFVPVVVRGDQETVPEDGARPGWHC